MMSEMKNTLRTVEGNHIQAFSFHYSSADDHLCIFHSLITLRLTPYAEFSLPPTRIMCYDSPEFTRKHALWSENRCLWLNSLGNTRVKATLAGYLRNERVPSSLIFAGTDPDHQLLFAMNFAKALACQKAEPVRRLRPLPPLPGHRPRPLSRRPGAGARRPVLPQEPAGRADRLGLPAADAGREAGVHPQGRPAPERVGGQRLPEDPGGAPGQQRLHPAHPEPQPHPAHHPVALPDPEVHAPLQPRGEAGAAAPRRRPGKSPPDGLFQHGKHGGPHRGRLAGDGGEAPRHALHPGAPHAPERGRGRPARPLRPQPRARDVHRLFPRDGQFDFRPVTGYNGADGRCRQRHAHQFGLQGKAHGTGGPDPDR